MQFQGGEEWAKKVKQNAVLGWPKYSLKLNTFKSLKLQLMAVGWHQAEQIPNFQLQSVLSKKYSVTSIPKPLLNSEKLWAIKRGVQAEKAK